MKRKRCSRDPKLDLLLKNVGGAANFKQKISFHLIETNIVDTYVAICIRLSASNNEKRTKSVITLANKYKHIKTTIIWCSRGRLKSLAESTICTQNEPVRKFTLNLVHL